MGQRKSTKGTKQIGAEVTAELVDELKAFCLARGETVRHHLEIAIRRHLDNPPPAPAIPPLPPVPPDPPSAPPKAARKKPRGGRPGP